jgi:hypothetical protein
MPRRPARAQAELRCQSLVERVFTLAFEQVEQIIGQWLVKSGYPF